MLNQTAMLGSSNLKLLVLSTDHQSTQGFLEDFDQIMHAGKSATKVTFLCC